MSRDNDRRLQWEMLPNGVAAIKMQLDRIRTLNPIGVAIQKIQDAVSVRAPFGGEWTSFETYVRILKLEGVNAVGLTVFIRDYPLDAEPNSLPDVCIRWTEWRGQDAVEAFARAADKLVYINDYLPVHCVHRFYHSKTIGIDAIMKSTSCLLSAGIAFAKPGRTESACHEMRFDFSDGELSYTFSYFLRNLSSMCLEQIIQEWFDYTLAVGMHNGVLPDDAFQVAYRESLWERIARYEPT